MLTQAMRDRWIARLESALSKQEFDDYGDIHNENAPHCAIGWLKLDIPNAELIGDVSILGSGICARIIRMNDKERKPLPEIAVWVKENVSVVEES